MRLLTATHRDLAAQVQRGAFREDLYFRLVGARLRVPPLRERRLDVLPIFHALLRQGGAPEPMQLGRLQPEAAWHAGELYERLLLHPWPGNARAVRAEALWLADLVRLRQQQGQTSPIPPLEELLAELDARRSEGRGAVAGQAMTGPVEDDGAAATLPLALPRHGPPSWRSGSGTLARDHGGGPAAIAAAQRAAVDALLADPRALALALERRGGGKIKRLDVLLAAEGGRSVESVRRAIYRGLAGGGARAGGGEGEEEDGEGRDG